MVGYDHLRQIIHVVYSVAVFNTLLRSCDCTALAPQYFVAFVSIGSSWAIIEAQAMAAPKPHIRNPLVRTVYNRMLEDEKRRNDDHSIVSLEQTTAWFANNSGEPSS